MARIEVALELTHRVQPRVQFVVAQQHVERGVKGGYHRCWRWRRDEIDFVKVELHIRLIGQLNGTYSLLLLLMLILM